MGNFKLDGRLDIVATLRGQTFTLRGEAGISTDTARLKLSYAAPSFPQAVSVGTFAEIADELLRIGKVVGGKQFNSGQELVNNLSAQLNKLPGFSAISKGLGDLGQTKIRITELALELDAPADGAELPPGTFTVGLGLDLTTVDPASRRLLGITLESIVLAIALKVGAT